MTMWLQRVLLLALLAAAGCGGGATTTGGGGGGEDTAEGDALADRGGGGEDSEDDTLGQCLTDQDCAALFPDLGPCQVAECDLKTLSCSVKDAADGTVCDDDDECTGNDMCTGGECGGEVVPCCGDGECNGDETCEDCQTDCGACPPECGDGFCNGEETCEDCPGDCGPCPSTCGNDECDGDEDCHTCPDDCGDCPAECGDGACNGEETCEDCVEDCGECPPECGDDVCDPEGESCALCAADCGECTGDCCAPQEAPGCEVPAVMMCVCEKDGFCCSVAWDEQCVGEVTEYLCGTCDAGTCGDGICGGDETCESCPGDCGACTTCGNNVCEPEESCVVCAKDCGLCEGDCCAPHEGPGCDDPAVSECVCSHEIGCCKDDWDADCVAQVTTFACGDCGPVVECGDGLCQGWETCELCPEDCGTCGAGSCCTPKETPKCEDAAITACVCAEDPYCCDTKWDWICVNEVDTLGCGTCQVCGDGACTGTEDSLSCCEDCGNCLAEGCPAVCECDEFCCGNWDDWCDVECSGTSCGDGVCQPCEDETTCAGDCAAPDPVCGDGICTADAGEDSHSCCEDCGNCAAHGCGDICECDPFCCSDWDEWCDLECAGTSCGDDICQPCETEDSCAEDCAAPDPFCGDGICTADAGEDATTCCEDCGNCSMRGCADVCVCDPFCCASWDEWCEVECNGTSCGDDVCQPCETEESCAEDCAAPVPVCGDGICTPEAGENGESCCEDCGLCASHGCADVCECDPYCCTDWDWICDAECAGTSCGDGYCAPCETEESCPEDCLEGGYCGDGACDADAGETADNCCEDCGACVEHGCDWVCECDPWCCTAWDSWCQAECDEVSCGDGSCQPCEDEAGCPEDCADAEPWCGDGVCEGDESCTTCPWDCGDCPICEGTFENDCAGLCYPSSWIGDDYCDDGQEPWLADFNCAYFDWDGGDCEAVCGDGECNGEEDCLGCPEDCGECPSNSCGGSCGAQAPGGCYCDAFCFTYGDCCSDICLFCEADFPEECGPQCGDGACDEGEDCVGCPEDCGACPDDSCGGRCGEQAPAGCFCDSLCFGYGDCCGDVCTWCGEDYMEECGLSVCGDGECDVSETCESCSEDCGLCPEESCAGICGGQAESGCYCDELCVEYGDCCLDYDLYCA